MGEHSDSGDIVVERRTVGGYVNSIGKPAHDDEVVELFRQSFYEVYHEVDAVGGGVSGAYYPYHMAAVEIALAERIQYHGCIVAVSQPLGVSRVVEACDFYVMGIDERYLLFGFFEQGVAVLTVQDLALESQDGSEP